MVRMIGFNKSNFEGKKKQKNKRTQKKGDGIERKAEGVEKIIQNIYYGLIKFKTLFIYIKTIGNVNYPVMINKIKFILSIKK